MIQILSLLLVQKFNSLSTEETFVEKIFSYLSLQEVNHIDEIREFIEKMKPDIELKGDHIQDTKRFL